jgi:hypothetical protein
VNETQKWATSKQRLRTTALTDTNFDWSGMKLLWFWKRCERNCGAKWSLMTTQRSQDHNQRCCHGYTDSYPNTDQGQQWWWLVHHEPYMTCILVTSLSFTFFKHNLSDTGSVSVIRCWCGEGHVLRWGHLKELVEILEERKYSKAEYITCYRQG